MKHEIKISWLGLITGFVLLSCCFCYFCYIVPYHICLKEQIQLFVFSSSYFLSYFSKPAVFACLAGDFLTQFLCFKSGGAAVITLLLAMEWWLIFLILKRFSVKTRHATSLLPVFFEWLSLSNHIFSLALSVSIIISLMTFITYIRNNGKISVAAGIILIPILYLLAGTSVFLFLILVVLYEIQCGRKRFIYWAVISVLAVAVPFIFRHYFLLTVKQAFLYPFPGIKVGLSLVVLALVVLLSVSFRKLTGFFSTDKFRNHKLIGAIIVLSSVFIVGLVKTTDLQQENLFGITTEAYHNNWDKVLDIAEKAEIKNPVATQYINIALSQKNLMGERLMDFYQPFTTGLLLPTLPSVNWFALFTANDAYYHIGDMDMAQHAAMVGMISTPRQRSVRLTKRLAEINLATGDLPAATKYIRILESTLFHRMKTESVTAQPSTKIISNSVQHDYSPQRKGIFRKDIIRRADDIKLSLELLVEGDPDNLPAVNYLLCYYLLQKNIPSFFEAYTSYCKGKIYPVPKVYAEALLIYLAGTKSTMKEVNEYEIHPDIIKAFGEYTRLYEKNEGNLLPVQEKFPNSYWLFFHFAVMNN